VAVLHGDDVVLSTAHGVADLEAGTPLTPDHRFRIASHSKTFTATAVVRLAAQGALRLDDTIGQSLTDLAGSDATSASSTRTSATRCSAR
jgi:D-alanyl-D-alanine carboxypeptidase